MATIPRTKQPQVDFLPVPWWPRQIWIGASILRASDQTCMGQESKQEIPEQMFIKSFWTQPPKPYQAIACQTLTHAGEVEKLPETTEMRMRESKEDCRGDSTRMDQDYCELFAKYL